jgi:phosphate transport system permease protein
MASVLRDRIPSSAKLAARDARRKLNSRLFEVWLWSIGVLITLAILAVIVTIVIKGLPAMTWEFLSTGPKEGMKEGGIWPMLRGSILLMIGTLLIVLPVGVFGGVFLAEYAGTSRLVTLVRACVVALAGTPSVIYGLFGLAVFVLLITKQTSLIAGCLTLAMFALPVIVLTTESAIKAVPESFVEAGVSLGMSKWQVIRKVILPAALPGIVTGLVLSTGRAAGEAPPILFTAGIYYSTAKLTFDFEMLKKPVANLPYHLAEGYRQGSVIPEKTIWGTCLTLMLLVLLINLAAIIVRARARKRQVW